MPRCGRISLCVVQSRTQLPFPCEPRPSQIGGALNDGRHCCNKSQTPREFLSQTYFWHGLLREVGVGPVHEGWRVAIPSPRAPFATQQPDDDQALSARDRRELEREKRRNRECRAERAPLTSEQMAAPEGVDGNDTLFDQNACTGTVQNVRDNSRIEMCSSRRNAETENARSKKCR